MLDVIINHNQYQNNDQESCHLLPATHCMTCSAGTPPRINARALSDCMR